MDKKTVKKRIAQISSELDLHNNNYYTLDKSEITDKEYDDLLAELIQLEDQYPDLRLSSSPSQRVGAKISAAAKPVAHKVKMYSLDNSYSIEDIKEWNQRVLKRLNGESVDYTVELKIDGVSAALTYANGELTMGATRGDGVKGENITHGVKTIKSVPLKLRSAKDKALPNELEVRGEVFMNRQDFERLNQQRREEGQDLFANARNVTSGSIKLLDSRITAERNLQFYVHSFGQIDSDKQFVSQSEFLDVVKQMGLMVDPHTKVCASIDDVIEYCLHFQDQREDVPYEVDGVVIKINSLRLQKELGHTIKSPRWAVAYKFPAQQVKTVVQQITIQVGRTGVLTPVAELKPVPCGGVTISRSTLHNFEEIERLGVNVGDEVLVERAGDVIPKIIKVLTRTQKKNPPFQIPQSCPECHSKIIKEEDSGVAYRCINPSCPKVLERSLLHFVSRGAMDIDGMGEAVVVQLLDRGTIKDLADIYLITKDDLLALDLVKDKKATKLLQSISDSKNQPLSRFLFGLGMSHVGQKASLLLAQKYQNLKKLSKAKSTELEAIHEIGSAIAESVETFFSQQATRDLIDKFASIGVDPVEAPIELESQELSDKKFVFTGNLESFSRSEAADRVKMLGGQVVSTVSKSTDFVVAGKAAGSKYQKAVSLGIEILTEEQFKEMIHV